MGEPKIRVETNKRKPHTRDDANAKKRKLRLGEPLSEEAVRAVYAKDRKDGVVTLDPSTKRVVIGMNGKRYRTTEPTMIGEF